MQRWRDILINFIVNLPNSKKFINIIVVINYFIKIQYIIPIVGITQLHLIGLLTDELILV